MIAQPTVAKTIWPPPPRYRLRHRVGPSRSPGDHPQLLDLPGHPRLRPGVGSGHRHRPARVELPAVPQRNLVIRTRRARLLRVDPGPSNGRTPQLALPRFAGSAASAQYAGLRVHVERCRGAVGQPGWHPVCVAFRNYSPVGYLSIRLGQSYADLKCRLQGGSRHDTGFPATERI
jgi:hypothetical protein